MKLATYKSGASRDGRLMVVSKDLRHCVDATNIAPNLLSALEQWDVLAPLLHRRYEALNAGAGKGRLPFEPAACAAPLPRPSQWLDGSDFPGHGHWVCQALGIPPLSSTVPLMYQRATDDMRGATDDLVLPDESLDIDLEGELVAVLDDVPMGVTAEQASGHVKLLMLANDCSLRALQAREMQSGFGMIQAKPSTSFSPVAVSVDELGPWWIQERLHRKMLVHRNGNWIGSPDASLMKRGFGALIAHAAMTRRLRAGALIGSGTVSDPDGRAGSAAIAEIRGMEIAKHGQARTPYLRFGERVRIEMLDDEGRSIFGAIDQAIGRQMLVEPTDPG